MELLHPPENNKIIIKEHIEEQKKVIECRYCFLANNKNNGKEKRKRIKNYQNKDSKLYQLKKDKKKNNTIIFIFEKENNKCEDNNNGKIAK